jgi:hypothetical protein
LLFAPLPEDNPAAKDLMLRTGTRGRRPAGPGYGTGRTRQQYDDVKIKNLNCNFKINNNNFTIN